MNDMSLSPSAWHEDAYARHPDHDAMQLGYFRSLKSKPGPPPAYGEKSYRSGHSYLSSDKVVFENFGVFAEYPIIARDRIIAFADIVVRAVTADKEYSRIWAYELKPKIVSVGAVLRQCGALELAFERSGRTAFQVYAVVFRDDPKLANLEEISPFPVVDVGREIMA